MTTGGIAGLEKRSFAAPDEVRTPFEKGRIEVISLSGLTFQREALEPGWRWSDHVKAVVGTERCERYHVKHILAGRQRVVMADGTELVLEPGGRGGDAARARRLGRKRRAQRAPRADRSGRASLRPQGV